MKRFVVWALISLAALNCSIAHASSLLSGKVTVDGNPVSDAVVTVYLLDEKQSSYTKSITSKTSDTGLYRFEGLPNGNYVLIVMKGDQRIYQGKIVVSEKRELVKDIVLTAEPPPKTLKIESIKMSFTLIPGGSFKMGSPDGEDPFGDEGPQHSVTISKPFYLQTTEVTQKQWREVMGSDPKDLGHKNCDDCPVEGVSWNDAQEFVRKLNQKEGGKKYRLPTEAEWEYACRAGSENKKFCFGNDEGILKEYAWYKTGLIPGTTHPVGQKKPNAWGLYDIHGNVKEWCQDWYGGYPSSQVSDPTGPKAGTQRVSRGGSFSGDAKRLRSANRGKESPDHPGVTVGFRVARDF